MEHRPITVDAAGVRAILAGRENKTIRAFEMPRDMQWYTKELSGNAEQFDGERTGSLCAINGLGWWSIDELACPYGQPGHTLWVREDALELGCWKGEGGTIWRTAGTVHYLADGQPPAAPEGLLWKEVPAIDLRRKHSRITLEIVSVQIAKREQWEWVIEFKIIKGGA